MFSRLEKSETTVMRRWTTLLSKKLLISSFPILLLIAVWIYFIRRYSGKSSPQNRSLDLIDQQNEMIQKQGEAIERIANALEADKNDVKR